MMRLMLAGLVLVGAVVAQPASGAVLTGTATNLTGATGVQVGSLGLFDVAFVDDSCNALFDGCSDFFFTTEADAGAASQALLDQVFLDSNALGGAFDAVPGLTAGCTAPLVCFVRTPFQAGTGSTAPRAIQADNFHGISADNTRSSPILATSDYADRGDSVYAVWSPSVTAQVPEPSILSLAGFGLLALMATRRRRRMQQPRTIARG